MIENRIITKVHIIRVSKLFESVMFGMARSVVFLDHVLNSLFSEFRFLLDFSDLNVFIFFSMTNYRKREKVFFF